MSAADLPQPRMVTLVVFRAERMLEAPKSAEWMTVMDAFVSNGPYDEE